MSGWKDHRGGACPVHHDTIVRLRFRGFDKPFESRNTYPAGRLRWSRRDEAGDIIAFQVIEIPEDLAA